MKYQVFDLWNTLSKTQEQLQSLYNTRFDRVLLYGPHEWNYWEWPEWNKLITACGETNHKLIIITSTKKFFTIEEPTIEIDHEIINWPTHYFSRTYNHLEPLRNGIPTVDNYQHHFVSMNYRPREWRCMLMDLIAKNKLQHFNAISWHDPNIEYDWKYWKPRLMQLSDTSFTQSRNYNILPNEYHTSFAQLISETRIDTLSVSEKTATAIFMEKPFLVASCSYFHEYLDKLGFLRYDEIFDYTFDTIEDTETRFNLLIDNFKNLSKVPFKDLPKLKEKIHDKLIYNKQRAYDIVHDYDLYPDVVKELINVYKQEGIKLSGILVDMYEKTFQTK